MNSPLPDSIPNYKILRELGRGGMATVYHAVQESLGREVALKVMAPELARDASYAERFLREGKVVAKLRHRNIVTVHDLGVSPGGQPFLAMEFESGGSVADRAGQLSSAEVLRCVRDIAAALDHAHSQGVIHRDVKPENILRSEDGHYLLSDFGIARVSEGTSALTVEGSTLGTPQYMSPEQWKGENLDGRADLYSLGVVLYQMLTGTLPYSGTDGWAIGMQHMSAPVPTLTQMHGTFQPLLERLLAKRPEDRPARGAEVVRWAESMMTATPLPASPYALQPVMAAAGSVSGPTQVRPATPAPIAPVPSGPVPPLPPGAAPRPLTPPPQAGSPHDVVSVRKPGSSSLVWVLGLGALGLVLLLVGGGLIWAYNHYLDSGEQGIEQVAGNEGSGAESPAPAPATLGPGNDSVLESVVGTTPEPGQSTPQPVAVEPAPVPTPAPVPVAPSGSESIRGNPIGSGSSGSRDIGESSGGRDIANEMAGRTRSNTAGGTTSQLQPTGTPPQVEPEQEGEGRDIGELMGGDR
jgi:serine/threonine-protein kinase PpkA